MRSIDQQDFIDSVLKSPIPVLVHFWAPWCGLCRFLDPILCKIESERAGELKVLGINADRSLELASEYRLTALPTLIVFDGPRILYRMDGYQGRDDLRAILDGVLERYQPARTATVAADSLEKAS